MQIASIAARPVTIEQPRPGTPPMPPKGDDWCGTPVPEKPEPCFPWGLGGEQAQAGPRLGLGAGGPAR